jgi:hypothetical protein
LRPALHHMDSLPDQRIETLPGATRQEAYDKIGLICVGRNNGISEDVLAKRVGFGGVEAMYHQLKTWGLTGLLPPEKQVETPKRRDADTKPERKAHSSDMSEAVPDVSAVADMLNNVLEELKETVKILDHFSLVYQGKRFAGSYTFDGAWVLPRSSYSEARWRELCKENGQDPDVEYISVPSVTSHHSTEASPYPPREIVMLIAAYALAGRPIEQLLKVLYPEHSQADIEEINKLLYATQSKDGENGLLRTAQKLAAAVYGRKVERGAPFELRPEKVQLASYITQRREAGVTDEEIRQEILDSGRQLSKEDFAWLADLGYRFPNT